MAHLKKKMLNFTENTNFIMVMIYQYLVPIINNEDDNDHNGHIGNYDIHDVFSGWVYIYLIMKMSRKFIFILNLDFVFFSMNLWTLSIPNWFWRLFHQFQIDLDERKKHKNKYDRWIITGSFLSFKKFVWKGNFLYPPKRNAKMNFYRHNEFEHLSFELFICFWPIKRTQYWIIIIRKRREMLQSFLYLTKNVYNFFIKFICLNYGKAIKRYFKTFNVLISDYWSKIFRIKRNNCHLIGSNRYLKKNVWVLFQNAYWFLVWLQIKNR